MTGAPVANWRQIKRMARTVVRRCGRDRFLKTVLKGSMRVGRSWRNPIRGNLAAAGLREAVGHVIHKLSPDEEVRACVWFVQAPDTPTVTRRQRANYIIKAGLPDPFVADVLKFDVKAHADELIEMVNGLNRSTHVRPTTVLTDGAEIRRMFVDVLSGLEDLLDAAEDSRKAVEQGVGTALHNAVFEKLIGEAIQELDELSTRTAIDHHWIDEIEVVEMDASEITYRVSGTVAVELRYGSGSDVANDIGFRSSDSYPYEATVTAASADPISIDAGDIDLKVDNSSFYG
jgi:hypothetical protein